MYLTWLRMIVVAQGCMFLLASGASARIKLPALISDNMVLQSGAKVRIWGTSEADERITLNIGDSKATTTADGRGRWAVELGPMNPGGPFDLVISGKDTTVVHNVLIGQVWICSGQSNMEFHVGPGPEGWEDGVTNYRQEIASAHYPEIRMFTVRKTVAGRPQDDIEGKWEVASPVTVGHFSAVGYFFGREIFESLHQPIGIIHSSWGGTPAESWTTLRTLQANPEYQNILDRWKKQREKSGADLNNFGVEFQRWMRESSQAETEGRRLPEPPPMPVDARSSPFYRPGGLYNAMIAPLVPYKIKGVIWYQGESNSDRGRQYRKLFPDMIRDWRRAWGDTFPFLYVQLASFDGLPALNSFPLIREAQLKALSLPNTAMAVTVDIGDRTRIHPKNKQEVGRRLALAARALVYKQRVVFAGPLYSSMTVERNKIRLYFKHGDDGLATTGHTDRLLGFEIAGADRKFYSAKAAIDGDSVVVYSDRVHQPVAVRYGWRNYSNGDLFNESGLPASPFRTDDWESASEAEQ